MSNRFGVPCHKPPFGALIESPFEVRGCRGGFVYVISQNTVTGAVWFWKLNAASGTEVFKVDIAPFVAPLGFQGKLRDRLVLSPDGAFAYFNAGRILKLDTADATLPVDRVIWESAAGGAGGLDIAADGDLRFGEGRVAATTGATVWGVNNGINSAGLLNETVTGANIGFSFIVRKVDQDGNLIWVHLFPTGPDGGMISGLALTKQGHVWVSYETIQPFGLNQRTRYRERWIDTNGVIFLEQAVDALSIFGQAFGMFPTKSRTGVTWGYRVGDNFDPFFPKPPRVRFFLDSNAEQFTAVDTIVELTVTHRGESDHYVYRQAGFESVARMSADFLTEIWTVPVTGTDGFVRSIGTHEA